MVQRSFALAVGFGFLVVGILRFVPLPGVAGWTTPEPVHGLLHLATGGPWLAAALLRRGRRARTANRWLGGFWLAVGIAGNVGWLALSFDDNAVHLVVGVAATAVAWAPVAMLPGANAIAWLADPPAAGRQAVGEYLASNAVLLLAAALVLATRARWLERRLGGLDRLYTAHRRLARAGFVLLVAHVAVVAWGADLRGGAGPTGLIAFVGIATLVGLAAAPRLVGYRRWRWTHHLIGVFFAIGFAHSLLVDAVLAPTAPARLMLLFGYGVGMAAYLYTRTLARLVRPRHRYTVAAVRRLGASTVEVTLRPTGRTPLRWRSGQFAIVSFRRRGLREPHPFTISGVSGPGLLALTVKAAGDHTARLVREVAAGWRAIVEGGYGRFDYRDGAATQVWVAGGIGVTPFLSWLRDDPDGVPRRITFVYAVRRRADAVCLDDLRHLLPRHPGVTLVLHVSAEDGRLNGCRLVAGVEDCDYYLCGPPGLLRSLTRELRSAGVPAGAIRHESFHLSGR